MKKFEFIAEKKGNLIDFILNEIPTNKGSILSALKNKDITINGAKIKENVEINVGDKITIYLNENKIKTLYKIYEDENILIINKSPNIEVCDGENNLLNLIKKEYKEVYAVHRLDRNTCGLVIFALNEKSRLELEYAFRNSLIKKYYIAEVNGKLNKKHDILSAYLVKDAKNSLVKIYDKKHNSSVKIITEYFVIKEKKDTSLVEILLHTGKTHQIRAHFAHIGNSLVGDGKYGDYELNKKHNETKQRLCAYKLCFDFNENSSLYYLNKKEIKLDSSKIAFLNI